MSHEGKKERPLLLLRPGKTEVRKREGSKEEAPLPLARDDDSGRVAGLEGRAALATI